MILTNCYSDFENSCVLPERLSDYYALKCELQFKVERPPKFEKVTINDYSHNNVLGISNLSSKY